MIRGCRIGYRLSLFSFSHTVLYEMPLRVGYGMLRRRLGVEEPLDRDSMP